MPEDIQPPQNTRNTPGDISNDQLPNSRSADQVSSSEAVSTSQQTPLSTPTKNNPGVLVLQWLTYAFWGWFILALAFLTAVTVRHFIDTNQGGSESLGSGVAYPLAAVVVLFVIAVICDFLYSKHEPERKQGAAMVIMIIHAVIFALCGIGALIAAVFAVVNLLIGEFDDGNTGTLTTLITGLVIACVYAVTLVRTLRPLKLKKASLLFSLFMAVVTIIVTALGVAGPAMHASSTRDDRLIEQGLAGVSEQVRDYAEENEKLPENLQVISKDLQGDAKTIVEKGLVEYKPGKQKTASSANVRGSNFLPATSDKPAFEYELCVTYKGKKGSPRYYDMSYAENDVSPDTYAHDKGYVCYDLVTRMTYRGY